MLFVRKCTGPNCTMYLQNVFLKIVKWVCQNYEMLLVLMVLPSPPFEPLRPSSQWWSQPLLMVLLVTMITSDDISRIYFSIMHLSNENLIHGQKKLIIIANQICINRRVDALCFVNLQNMQNWLKTATFISEPVAVNCLKPMTRGQRSVALY